MKRILIFISFLLFTGCYSHLQIATYHSDNIIMNDYNYRYNDDILSIDYKFNNEGGIFTFTITNKSEKDIYIVTNKSYFALNGSVHDYAGRSTTSSLSNFSINGTSYTSSHATSTTEHSSTLFHSDISGTTISQTQTIGEELIIPPGCHRTFETFYVERSIYINNNVINGLIDGNDSTIYFLKENSPISLINAIAYIHDGIAYEAISEIYLKNIQTLKVKKSELGYVYENAYKNQVIKRLYFNHSTPIQYLEWSERWVRIED